MSEDDRAAKAARARAMLKRRQQQQKGTSGIRTVDRPPTSSASSTPQPTAPLAPPNNEHANDAEAVFGKVDTNDTAWIASLPRAGATSPPAPDAVNFGKATSPTGQITQSRDSPADPPGIDGHVQELVAAVDEQRKTISLLETEKENLTSLARRLEDAESKSQVLFQQECSKNRDLEQRILQLEAEMNSQQQTINLLVSDKASFANSLDHMEKVEADNREKDVLLQQFRAEAETLQTRTQQLEDKTRDSNERIQLLLVTEKELSDRCREQERELQLVNGDLNTARAEAARHRASVRELEDRIQSDDRAERLEISLKNTQDRADDLEFQFSKLKQAHATLKAERDGIESQLHSHREGEIEWKSKCVMVQKERDAAQATLNSLTSRHDVLLQEKTSLETEVAALGKRAQLLEDGLARASMGSDTVASQLQSLHAELRSAIRRAEEAEATQKALQYEGTGLMRSLDELRTKVVELTSAKAELGENVDALQHAMRGRDSVIAQLESSLEEIRAEKEHSETLHRESIASGRNERSSTQGHLVDLQEIYGELQAKVDVVQKRLSIAQANIAAHRRETSRRLEGISRPTTDLLITQKEWEERRAAEEERDAFLQLIEDEVESLRLQLAPKEEVDALREAVPSSSSSVAASRSLDGELLNALRQQHALDVSAAHSTIRALETSVFEAEARSHSLQKQVQSLQDELAALRGSPGPSYAPTIPRPSSRATSHTHTTHDVVKPTGLGFGLDQGLPPAARHRRKVSLSMLKARMESEAAAVPAAIRPSSRALASPRLPGIPEPASLGPSSPLNQHFKRPQFLDESHVFWCHSCHGDLVIL